MKVAQRFEERQRLTALSRRGGLTNFHEPVGGLRHRRYYDQRPRAAACGDNLGNSFDCGSALHGRAAEFHHDHKVSSDLAICEYNSTARDKSRLATCS